MTWQDADEYKKLNHCVKLFGNVFFPKSKISDRESSVKYSFKLTGGWGEGLFR
jgi:hypothetical protein